MTNSLSRTAQIEQRAATRRLARRVLAILDYDRIWTGPMGRVAVEAAVVHGIECLFQSGQTDPVLIIERVLHDVCGDRPFAREMDMRNDPDAAVGKIKDGRSAVITH